MKNYYNSKEIKQLKRSINICLAEMRIEISRRDQWNNNILPSLISMKQHCDCPCSSCVACHFYNPCYTVLYNTVISKFESPSVTPGPACDCNCFTCEYQCNFTGDTSKHYEIHQNAVTCEQFYHQGVTEVPENAMVEAIHGFNFKNLRTPPKTILSEDETLLVNGQMLSQNSRIVDFLSVCLLYTSPSPRD